MNILPCHDRSFRFNFNVESIRATSLRWFRHLVERLGLPVTLEIWEKAFTGYDEARTAGIFASGWQPTVDRKADPAPGLEETIQAAFAGHCLEISTREIEALLDKLPPIPQAIRYLPAASVEKEISAYEALHLRFDGLAHLAETLIGSLGKQGELIVYDLMVESRLASAGSETGSVAQFIEDFTRDETEPSLFTAGLQTEVVRKSDREAVVWVRECEWARYFRERHPGVGYLMACSTDEVAYRAFNNKLRMQRTRTLMEGAEICDFRVYSVE